MEPTAPASVGEATPKKIDPRTRKISKKGGKKIFYAVDQGFLGKYFQMFFGRQAGTHARGDGGSDQDINNIGATQQEAGNDGAGKHLQNGDPGHGGIEDQHNRRRDENTQRASGTNATAGKGLYKMRLTVFQFVGLRKYFFNKTEAKGQQSSLKKMS